MPHWISSPQDAWNDYVLPEASTNPKWVNDSKPISETIGINKRELFGLVILAHLYNGNGVGWKVGYDPNQEQPNDGFITNDEYTIRVEHKVIVEEAKQEVLDEVLSTYRKNAAKGPDYGKDRVLIIQPNKAPAHGGMIKISQLAQEIGDQCNFDRVLTLSMVAKKGEADRTAVMHLVQQYPRIKNGIAQVDFDFPTGTADVPHCGIEL